MKQLLVILFLFFSSILQAQNILKVAVKSDGHNEPLAGASVTIPSLQKGTATDSLGMATLQDLPSGNFEILISYVGFGSKKQKVVLPANNMLVVTLQEVDEDEDANVVVTATRTDRSVRNTPTRVEVIAGGEIAESASMRPGEIKMLLNESTGIITQQTSAISNTANLRIQELDGRYTQILRDGFPLYSGLAEGLSLVQIAPLDLRQVEIIKGSSSTLYGGGAIAGLINLVSKTPGDKRELSFLANATSTKGLDLSGFYSQRYGKVGVTLFTARNSGTAYDPSGIGLTAIPKFSRYTVVPRIFIYGKKTDVNAGISFITEYRLGGSMDFIKSGAAGFFEKNNSDRFSTQLGITHQINEHQTLNFKNSYNHFNRRITLPAYQFEGLQQSSFSELSWNMRKTKSEWVIGANVYTDNFTETPHATSTLRNYNNHTVGTFIQNTWSLVKGVNIESGLRGDYTKPFGFILLPRISLLFHLSDALTTRIGGGFGYKVPTIFNEESEELQFKNIAPLNKTTTAYERSVGGNIDFTYRVNVNELKITVNPLLFYTRINHPLTLGQTNGGLQQFKNADGYTDSKGIDVTTRFALNDYKFFIGYSFTNAQNHFNGNNQWYNLAPRHRLHFDLVYELEQNIRVAFESYYTSSQQLSDGATGRSYWLLGALVEKTWKHFALFINGEDLNDARQTKWEPIYTGSVNNPTFRDIYAPLEGRTINAGLKIKL